ncbi:MAG: alpha/beta fold hydrolase [Pseudomonadota bacterium]
MAAVAIRVIIGVALAYLAAMALLYAFQARFLYPAPQDRHDPAAGFTAVTLNTADGLALNAHYRAPEADQPTVVFFHGNGGSLAAATEETALLTTQGYGALLVSYRGYGGNPGEPSEEGFYTDGRAAMAFLQSQGVTPARTIIMGNSIGSGTATQMATEFEAGALILVAPFLSLPEVVSDALPIFPVSALLKDRYDNAAKVPKLSMPVLVQHGTADRVVPFDHGRALAKAGPTATFQSFEGVGHDLSFNTQAQVAQSEWLVEQGL